MRSKSTRAHDAWSGPACAFPKEADAAMVDSAAVRLRVAVGANGVPQTVQISSDPGFGFARAATRCAMSKRYLSSTDAQGVPIAAWTPFFEIHFAR